VVEGEEKKRLLVHAFRRAFRSDAVMMKLLDKLVPSKTAEDQPKDLSKPIPRPVFVFQLTNGRQRCVSAEELLGEHLENQANEGEKV